MMLRKVVFPDPLAPTIPTSSPRRNSTFTPSAARTAPNDLVRSSVDRIASATGHLARPSREPGRELLVNRPQPARAEQDDGQHDHTERHLPLVREVLRGIRSDELEGDGPDQRSQHARVPAQERDEDELSGQDPEGVLGNDVPNDERGQDAPEPGQRARENV